MYAFGNLDIVAECNLGHLGPKEGKLIAYYWNPLYNFLSVLVWIPLLLAFVLLKENRKPAALWILLPACGFWALYQGIASITYMPGDIRAMFVTAVYCVAISFCLVWLLAGRIGGRHRFLTAVLALLIFAVLTALSLPVTEPGEGMELLGIFVGLSYAAFTIAFTVAAVLCRKRITGVRFALWMIPGCLIGTFISYSIYLIFLVIQYYYPEMVMEFLMITLVASGLHYAILLPFLVLFFVSDFWRRRFTAVTGLGGKVLPLEQSPEMPTPAG